MSTQPLIERLETVAWRIDATLLDRSKCMLGTKHPREVREAASRIAELETAHARRLQTVRDLMANGETSMPLAAVMILLGAPGLPTEDEMRRIDAALAK